MRLGKNQLELLRFLRPGMFRLVPDKISISLIKLGLLQAWDGDGIIGSTSKGLRHLADEADAGRLDLAPNHKFIAETSIKK